MTDHTSDDLLNQPEPADESGLLDDPVVDAKAVQDLVAFFNDTPASAPMPPADPVAGARVPAQVQAEPPSIEEVVGSDPGHIEKLEQELRAVKRELALLKLAPAERYPEVLKDAEITMEEAHQVLDCVIIQLRPWVERVKVSNRLFVTFQTRGQMDLRRLDRWAEETRPQLDTTVFAEALLNNMAASLLEYGDRKFTAEDEEKRYKMTREFLVNMPYPAFRLVQEALARFDAKINAIFSDGYLENF